MEVTVRLHSETLVTQQVTFTDTFSRISSIKVALWVQAHPDNYRISIILLLWWYVYLPSLLPWHKHPGNPHIPSHTWQSSQPANELHTHKKHSITTHLACYLALWYCYGSSGFSAVKIWSKVASFPVFVSTTVCQQNLVLVHYISRCSFVISLLVFLPYIERAK